MLETTPTYGFLLLRAVSASKPAITPIPTLLLREARCHFRSERNCLYLNLFERTGRSISRRTDEKGFGHVILVIPLLWPSDAPGTGIATILHDERTVAFSMQQRLPAEGDQLSSRCWQTVWDTTTPVAASRNSRCVAAVQPATRQKVSPERSRSGYEIGIRPNQP